MVGWLTVGGQVKCGALASLDRPSSSSLVVGSSAGSLIISHARRGRCCQRRRSRAIEHTIVALILDPSIPISHVLLIVNVIERGLVLAMSIPNPSGHPRVSSFSLVRCG